MTDGDFDPEVPEEVLDEPLPLWEVAGYAGVSPELIRQWKRRGRISSPCDDEFGRPMYLLRDVWRAQDTPRRSRRCS